MGVPKRAGLKLPDLSTAEYHFQKKYQVRLARAMRGALVAAGLKQADLAERAVWEPSYVSRLLSGNDNITLATVARFEHAVGCSLLEVNPALLVSPERREATGQGSHAHVPLHMQNLFTHQFILYAGHELVAPTWHQRTLAFNAAGDKWLSLEAIDPEE